MNIINSLSSSFFNNVGREAKIPEIAKKIILDNVKTLLARYPTLGSGVAIPNPIELSVRRIKIPAIIVASTLMMSLSTKTTIRNKSLCTNQFGNNFTAPNVGKIS